MRKVSTFKYTNPTWGGVRAGAGRRAIDPAVKRVSFTASISAETYARLRDLKAQGVNIGRFIDDLVANF